MSASQDEARCAEAKPLLHALADDELDAANTLRCEAHLTRCGGCATEFAAILAMRNALRCDGVAYRAPDRLRLSVLAAVEAEALGRKSQGTASAWLAWLRHRLAAMAAAPRRWSWWQGARLPALALATGLAAALLVVTPRPSGQDGEPVANLRQEVVAGHIRSLLTAGHLTDVGSSDHHTVKPWFAGRLDFSPPVPDLAGAGFPLVGGRLDYLDGRPVAALVYRRRAHVINVFVWPESAPATSESPRKAAGGARHDSGHAVLHWRQGGMEVWAVSDLNAAELGDFARLFESGSTTPAAPQ